MPRSRSSSIESSSCGRCLRGSTAPVVSRMRSASVDLPWSIWAMIEKFRMFRAGPLTPEMLGAGDRGVRSQAAQLPADQRADLARLRDAQYPHAGGVHGGPGQDREPDRHALRPQRPAELVIERPPD